MGGTDVLRVELAPELVEVATARRLVLTHLPDVSSEVSSDAQLIVSELVTNAVEHGLGGPVIVALDLRDNDVTITVESVGPAPGVGSVDEWEIADPSDITGRGLGIVRAVADFVDVMRSPGRLVITAHLSI